MFGRELLAFRSFILVIAAYGVMTYAWSRAVARTDLFAPTQYALPVSIAILLVYAVLRIDCRLRRAWAVESQQLYARALFLCCIGFFLGTFTSAKNLMPTLVSFYADPILAKIDVLIHGDDVWELLYPAIGDARLSDLLETTYSNVWGTLFVIGPASVGVHPAFDHIRRQFFSAFIASWIVLGNVLAMIGMSGGPIFYGRLTGDNERFADLDAHIAKISDGPVSPLAAQDYLWSAFNSGSFAVASGISAFPSLHVAMATLYMLVSLQFSAPVKTAGIAFLILTGIGSVYLGWHYAIDGYVSFLFVVGVWMLSRKAGAAVGEAPESGFATGAQAFSSKLR